MQTKLDRKLNDKFVYGGGRVMFALFFLLSIIPIRSTLASTLGAQVIFEVFFMWISLLLAGLMIWQSAHKQRMDRSTAGVVLMQIGVGAVTGFSALATLATHR